MEPLIKFHAVAMALSKKNGRERHAQNFIKENEQAINNTLAVNKPARTVPTSHLQLINELGDEAWGTFVSELAQVLHV